MPVPPLVPEGLHGLLDRVVHLALDEERVRHPPTIQPGQGIALVVHHKVGIAGRGRVRVGFVELDAGDFPPLRETGDVPATSPFDL